MSASADLPSVVIDVGDYGPRQRTLPCPTCGQRVQRIEGLARADVAEYADTSTTTSPDPIVLLPCTHQVGSVSIRYVS